MGCTVWGVWKAGVIVVIMLIIILPDRSVGLIIGLIWYIIGYLLALRNIMG